MARKDVDLVIRAKDQAQGAISAITEAIEKFTAAQGDIQKQAAKTDTAFDRLGSSLSGLQKALGGLGVNAKVGEELDRARAATERLTASTKETAQAAVEYAAKAKEAARATEDLQKSSNQIARQVERQQEALKRAASAQETLTKVSERAAKDRASLAAAEARLTQQIEAQQTKIVDLNLRYRDLQRQIMATEKPNARLQTSFDATGRAIDTAVQRLRSLNETHSQVRISLDGVARATERAKAIYGGTAGAIETQKQNLLELAQAQRQADEALAASVSNQRSLERAATEASAALSKQEKALEQAQAGYRELQTVSAGAAAALSSLERSARGPMLKAFGQQAQDVQRLKQEFAEFSRTAQRLGQELSRTADPSQAMVSAFNNAREAAARTREQYRAQLGELAEMRRVLKETGGDIDAFAARQARLQAARDRAADSAKKYAVESQRATDAARRESDETDRATRRASDLARRKLELADASMRGAKGTKTFAEAMREFYGDSRQALNYMQRLRGEVLALITTYAGLYSVINTTKTVITSFQALEAATNRLNVAFDGDKAKVSQELDFIRRNAERLGVEFGSLAQEYTKFAIATKGTSLQGQETRNIFISVAEAARVNNATLPELQGTFMALTQIVNKGTVSMEELRQQLGDRLPGAIQIMADAAGVSVGELTKLIEQGKISSSILTKFADQLDKRFGPALAKSLTGTTAELGRLKDALFQAAVKVAEGGFITKFTEMIRDMNEVLRSAQFESFLNRVSVAMGAVADMTAWAVRNFDILGVVIAAIIAKRFAGFVAALASSLGLLTGSSVSTVRGFRALAVAVNTGAVSMTRAQVAARALTITLRGLMSSTGIGLAVVAIGAALGAWVTSTDGATAALDRHQRLLDVVKNKYDEAGQKIDVMKQKLESVTMAEAQRDLRDLTQGLEDIRSKAKTIGGFFGPSGAAVGPIDDAIRAFREGKTSAADFIKELNRINTAYPSTKVNEIVTDLIDIAREAGVSEKKIKEAEAIISVLGGTAEEAAAGMKSLTGEVEGAAKSQGQLKEETEKSKKAMDDLRRLVPEVAEQLDYLDKKGKIEEALKAALQYAQTWGDVRNAITLAGQAMTALDSNQSLKVLEGASGAVDATARLLRQQEGLAGGKPALGAYWDVNAFRIGYGSDTVTLSDGSIRKVTEGMRIAASDAERDLARRIMEFQNGVKGQIGADTFNSFGANQQAVLTSLAYNYGSLPGAIVKAIRDGAGVDEIAAAIRGLSRGTDASTKLNETEKKVLRRRRGQEADIFAADGARDMNAYVETVDAAAKAQAEAAEEAEKQRDATRETIQNGQFEIDQQNLLLAGKEREAAIQEAIRAAKAENPKIGEQELRQITEQAGRLFDLQEAEKNRLTDKEKAEAAEKRVNDLLALRQEMQTQLEETMKAGNNPAGVAGLREGLAGVNSDIQTAIASAIQLFEALGSSDPAVAAVISRLKTLAITSQEVTGKMVFDWSTVEQMLSSSLVNAANRFSESLAEGKSITESSADAFRQFASDFLRQISQMILQQLALNAAKSIGRAFGFSVAHTGGVVGQQGARRVLSGDVLAGAMRYHSGGVAGLRPNEVPTILERGEEVLTRADPRHIFNVGKGPASSGASRTTKVVNMFDAKSFLESALAGGAGEDVILNHVRANATSFRAALEG